MGELGEHHRGGQQSGVETSSVAVHFPRLFTVKNIQAHAKLLVIMLLPVCLFTCTFALIFACESIAEYDNIVYEYTIRCNVIIIIQQSNTI